MFEFSFNYLKEKSLLACSQQENLSLQSSLIYIVWELAGGESVVVAVGVGDRGQVIGDR